MGDYSSTFTILNLLDNNLSIEYKEPANGYWLHTVNIVEANAQSGMIQLKNHFGQYQLGTCISSVYFPGTGPMGTDGKVLLQGLFKGINFIANIHVICGMAESNVATIEFLDKQLKLSVEGFFDPHVNSMTGSE